MQLAKRREAHVTALTSLSKAKALEALGADVTLGRNEAPQRLISAESSSWVTNTK